MSRCQRGLAGLWFVGGGILFLVLIVQSLLGRYADKTTDAWSWFLPTVMPTLSLIIGVLVAEALGRNPTVKSADRFLYRFTLALSAAYLIVVFLVFGLKPFTSVGPIELMNESNLWLGPLQGLVAAALGAFFVKAEGETSDATSPASAKPESAKLTTSN
jgi:hypothetical protein